MSGGEAYVFAAYLVVLAVVLGWLVIHAVKLARLSREIGELAERARARRPETAVPDAAEARVARQ